jgi:hypothetical protein
MKKVLCSILPTLAIALLLAVSGAAFAQVVSGADTLQAVSGVQAASDGTFAQAVSGNPFAQVSGPAFAIAPVVVNEDVGEFFTTNYFANNTATGAPDATLRFTEHYGAPLVDGALCANIYVFAADQQETECCSCLVTANGLVTASVRTDLTSNPLTGRIPADGVVQIISSKVPPNGCDPTVEGAIATLGPSPEVDSWMTQIQNKVGTPATYPITESEGQEEALTTGEYLDLVIDCSFVREFGSGQGTCTCGVER